MESTGNRVFVLRRLLTLALAANLLVAGFVGSLHFHVHPGDCSGCHEIAEAAPHAHCCGHGHGHGNAEHCHVDLAGTGESDTPHAPTEPHDDEHCAICRLIATAWLPPAVVVPIARPEFVRPLPAVSPGRPVAAPLTLPLPRGPPTLV